MNLKYNTNNIILFEPTVSILKNALLINYKKVGTRFFGKVASWPKGTIEYKQQVDFRVVSENEFCINTKDKLNPICEYPKLDYLFNKNYIFSQFDLREYLGYDTDTEGFVEFNNSIELLRYLNVKTYNELFFENKERDIVFIIRNPIKRILSGITQIIMYTIGELYNNEILRNELKFYTHLQDSNIKNVIRYCNQFAEIGSDSKLEIESLNKIYEFILFKKWDLIFGDIHTENYLHNYIEWIYNIKNKSRIKIVDLEYCSSNKALNFFSNLKGDDSLKELWKEVYEHTETNKVFYNMFLEFIINKREYPLWDFLKSEFNHYNSLIESPYYVDLKD